MKKAQLNFISGFIIVFGFFACQSQENKYSISSDSTNLKIKSEGLKDSNIYDSQISSYSQNSKSGEKINLKVNEMYENNRISIVNVTPLMDKDFNKVYSIKIHNGSARKVVGLILNFNFNMILGDIDNGFKRDNNESCVFDRKIQLSINSKSDKIYKSKSLAVTADCSDEPNLTIKTVVFSDGTFQELRPRTGILGAIDESEEKEKIRKNLTNKNL